MEVYKAKIVQELESFYGDLLFKIETYPVVKDHLERISERMWKGIKAGHPTIFQELSNCHPDYFGKTIEEIQKEKLTHATCKRAVAKQYGFKNWKFVQNLGRLEYDQAFEQAINHLLEGDLGALKEQLSINPGIINRHSKYGHRATLLHYTASNGVELWRQKVPANLVKSTIYLLRMGADKNAKMKVYGGEFDTLSLLLSSAHPVEAGLMEEMKALLE